MQFLAGYLEVMCTPLMVGSVGGHSQTLLGCRAETMILESKGGSPLTLGQYRAGIYCSRIMRKPIYILSLCHSSLITAQYTESLRVTLPSKSDITVHLSASLHYIQPPATCYTGLTHLAGVFFSYCEPEDYIYIINYATSNCFVVTPVKESKC